MPGPYQIQAAIAAVHTDADTADRTQWSQIVALYDQLLAYMPTPIVALNRAIAVAEVDGPAAALPLVDQLDLDSNHLYHATRADLLERLGRDADALDAYDRALALVTNTAEQRHLERRRAVGARPRLAVGDSFVRTRCRTSQSRADVRQPERAIGPAR